MTESQEYDVFLSHSSKDKPAVERIADRLRAEEGIQPFLDSGTCRRGLLGRKS